MKKNIILLSLTVFTILKSFSQDVSLKGQVAVTTDLKSVFLNFGGAGLTLKTKPADWSINFIPAIRFASDEDKNGYTILQTKLTLGIGPQVAIKHLIISAPAFYLFSQTWTFTLGAGYKF